MRIVPMPVGGETSASCGLYPAPAEYAFTTHGSSQPMIRSPAAVDERIQNTVVPCDRCPSAVSERNSARMRSGTGGHLDTEEADRTEREDEHEDREDERLAPFTPEQRPSEHIDDADEETADAGADDVADPSKHGRGERDDSKMESDVPFEDAVVDAVDDRGRRRERRTDEERRRDRAIDF